MQRACLILLATLTLTPAAAQADVIAMDQHVCKNKKAGDACGKPLKGVCEPGECCRRRYGRGLEPSSTTGRIKDDNGPNSGPETYQECRDCLRCAIGKRPPAAKPKPTPDMAPDTAPDLSAAPDMEPPAPDMTPAAPDMPAPAAPDMAPPAPDMTPAAATEKPKGGMCATAPWHSDAGAWSLFAGALLLAGLATRRR